MDGHDMCCLQFGVTASEERKYYKQEKDTSTRAQNICKVKYYLDTYGNSEYGLNRNQRIYVLQKYIWENDLYGLNINQNLKVRYTRDGDNLADNNYSRIIRNALAIDYVTGYVVHYSCDNQGNTAQDVGYVVYSVTGKLKIIKQPSY